MCSNQSTKKGRASDEDRIIGNNLRRLRKLRGMSQQKLGEIIGMSYQQIQKYELGYNRIAALTLLRISEALGYDFRLFYSSLLEEDQPNIRSQIFSILRLLNKVDDPKLLTNIEDLVSKAIYLDEESAG